VQLPVNGRSVVDITLSEEAEVLKEVVVTALGFEEDEDEVGYASSTFGGSTVTQAAEPTVINALSGKASGVRQQSVVRPCGLRRLYHLAAGL